MKPQNILNELLQFPPGAYEIPDADFWPQWLGRALGYSTWITIEQEKPTRERTIWRTSHNGGHECGRFCAYCITIQPNGSLGFCAEGSVRVRETTDLDVICGRAKGLLADLRRVCGPSQSVTDVPASPQHP